MSITNFYAYKFTIPNYTKLCTIRKKYECYKEILIMGNSFYIDNVNHCFKRLNRQLITIVDNIKCFPLHRIKMGAQLKTFR